MTTNDTSGLEIAVIGMAGRFPGAATIDQFWQNLCAGRESVTFFSDQELLAAGVRPELLRNPAYVKARATLDDVELFDAQFFGYTPKEAEVMDPQHRLFLECVWEALETAGYSPAQYAGPIGVFAGGGRNTYLINNLLPNRALLESSAGLAQAMLGNDKEHLTMQAAYKLNLRGPGITVQTACSTSLVAVHLACQSLLAGDCNIALAGGARVFVPQRSGHVFYEGGINSPDGHCRAFDAAGQGIVGGDGVAVVVLKRLDDALADGDQIAAVIKGSAINNDGAQKVGYTAPGVEGQAQVIRAAQEMAGVSAETIGYVEAHGTGTALGDPTEIAALTQAFRATTARTGFCAIGSVKTNVGHLDVTAGVAGLIKTVLALKHGQIPPSINFTRPNPAINFDDSPFFVATGLLPWAAGPTPRRAGVSAFGIGGTNAHVILEEAPPRPDAPSPRPWHTLPLSARTPAALEAATARLTAHLRQHPEQPLADVAYTLQLGRQPFAHRRALVAADREDALQTLVAADPRRMIAPPPAPPIERIAFLFPGQGTQYVQMARGVYESEPLFRATLDRCAELLQPQLDADLRQLIFPAPAEAERAAVRLRQTAIAQPALFAVEYALAKLWMAWKVRPHALLGHSVGEYVAACLAGVLTLPDALALVAMRGRLMQQLPAGAMLAVALPEHELRPWLGLDLSLAAINGPRASVVAGTSQAIAALEAALRERAIECRPLHTSHAFHSWMVEPIISEWTTFVATLPLSPPQVPYISNVSGSWITAAEATDPAYWARQLREPVRFADGLSTLLGPAPGPAQLLLELGPGPSLTTLARQQIDLSSHVLLPTMRHAQDAQPDALVLHQALARAWVAGAPVSWAQLYRDEQRRRVALPTYPFERQRYWIAPPASAEATSPASVLAAPQGAHLQRLGWSRSPLGAVPPAAQPACWLLFAASARLATALRQRVAPLGIRLVVVLAGERFTQDDPQLFQIDPRRPADYAALIDAIHAQDAPLTVVIHGWSLRSAGDDIGQTFALGLPSVLRLAAALAASDDPPRLAVLSAGQQSILGETTVDPVLAALQSAGGIVAGRYAYLPCAQIDLPPRAIERLPARLVDALVAGLLAAPGNETQAYRGDERWVQRLEPLGAPTIAEVAAPPGVVLLSAGLDERAYALVAPLSARQPTLLLIEPPGFPERERWPQWLAEHDDRHIFSRKLHQIAALEAAGARIRIGRAAPGRLAHAVDQLCAEAGPIDAIVHVVPGADQASDVYDDLAALRRCADELAELAELCAGRADRFCVVLPPDETTSAADAALAQCVQSFAQQHNQRHAGGWLCVQGLGREDVAGSAPLIVTLGALVERGRSGTVVVQLDATAQAGDPRRAAPASATPLHPRPALDARAVAPQDALEQEIALIWQDLLGIQEIGVHDDFFQLGGHSIMGMQIAARLQETFQVELPLRSLFESSTIAGLAQLIRAVQQLKRGAAQPAQSNDWEQGDL